MCFIDLLYLVCSLITAIIMMMIIIIIIIIIIIMVKGKSKICSRTGYEGLEGGTDIVLHFL
jgi:hypothetical protein